MTMNMKRAFNAKMKTRLIHYTVAKGSFNDQNDWVEGKAVVSRIWGVMTSGNKFSQFQEGEAILNTESGIRKSNYRQLWVEDRYKLKLGDKLGQRGKYYNLLQHTDEVIFGFQGFLIEEAKNWSPK